LSFRTNYAPAFLLRGRLQLAAQQASEAVELFQAAARLNPLPEYQWALADALRAANRDADAIAIEEQLRRRGAAADPRTLALFLATRHELPQTAVNLSRAEFETRSDVFTHDALAWSLAAAGRLPEAEAEMERALAEGTEDARLFFHAAMIAAQSGRTAEAQRRFDQATAVSHLLLPSEREQLRTLAPRLAHMTREQPAGTAKNFSALQN
jgi:tetratricopeptide (TPR) repeat protein